MVKVISRRMSKVRKALFAQHNVSDYDAKRLHLQIVNDYNRLLVAYSDSDLPFTDDPEHNGNLILQRYFDSQAKRERQQQERYETADRLASEFRSTFGVALHNYRHPILGFNVIGFDENVVKPNENESCKDAIRRQWGYRAVEIVVELMK